MLGFVLLGGVWYKAYFEEAENPDQEMYICVVLYSPSAALADIVSITLLAGADRVEIINTEEEMKEYERVRHFLIFLF